MDFKKKVLKNGMTILFEKRDIPVVSVAFAVRAGGINESMEEKGIFHFIEHMLFKGTEKRTVTQIVSEIERNGGEVNAGTDDTVTFYYCKMPSKHLNVALDVLGDIVRNPKVDENELNKERQVIFEEIRMNHDTPVREVFRKIQKTLYENPFAEGTLGTYDSLKSIDREKMVEKFRQVYQPNNMILCVIGDADFDEILNYTEKNFGNEKGEIPAQKFDLRNEEKIETRKGIDQANLVFAYHVPFGDDKKKYSARVLSALMAEGMSSRLFSEIREKRNLAYAVKGGSDTTKDFGHNFIYVGTMKENVEKVKELILKELKDVSENLESKELNSVKEQIIGQHQIGMEDSQNQMVNLLYSEVNGNAEEFYEFEKNIREVKLENVKELAKKASEKFSFFALVPE